MCLIYHISLSHCRCTPTRITSNSFLPPVPLPSFELAYTALLRGTNRKPLSPELKDSLDRLSVIWCVRDGRPLESLKDDVRHKLILSKFVPEYAASDTSHPTLDKVLASLYDEAKSSLVAKLKGVRDELQQIGYSGPFCSLQLEMTSINNDEFCTASVSVIL